MVQLTYYSPPQPRQSPPAVLGRRQPMHGYDLDEIHRAVRVAVSTKLFLAADRKDLYEAAWDGAVDLLCTCNEPPSRHDLVRAGQVAIQRLRDEWIHHHGYDRVRGTGGASNFQKYWAAHPTWQSTVEETVVDRIAKNQIVATLPSNELRALLARAAADNLDQAVEISGWSHTHFGRLIADARRRFHALWHQHESPPRMHRKQYMRKLIAHQPCGTPAGYRRHRYHKQQACDACRAAMTTYARGRRARAEVS